LEFGESLFDAFGAVFGAGHASFSFSQPLESRYCD
jgi:hypothetical protein